MIPSFDVRVFNEPAYKKILGLEEDGTVSDWYSLLGVEKFECDEAKIDQAMLQRFERARRYQVGSYEDQALRLIDELGRAYVCLTNEQDRREYDQTLVGGAVAEVIAATAVALAEGPSAPVDAKGEVGPVIADEAICPQCGKPTSPKAAVCYQCGYKKPTAPKQVSNENKRGNASMAVSSQGLVRQDLTPEQLLARLKETRKLMNAAKRAVGIWRTPKPSTSKSGTGEASSHCRGCSKGLMQASDAYGILESEVRSTRAFLDTYARKLESLGRANFEWPLSDEDVRQVRLQMADSRGNNVALYCRGCASRIFRSPQVVS